ncbi:hypothetical protein ACFV0W_33010, partial [Streptomyces anulatus]
PPAPPRPPRASRPPDGERLWQFQHIASPAPKGATVSAPYRALAAGETVVVQRDRAFYAFPVA